MASYLRDRLIEVIEEFDIDKQTETPAPVLAQFLESIIGDLAVLEASK